MRPPIDVEVGTQRQWIELILGATSRPTAIVAKMIVTGHNAIWALRPPFQLSMSGGRFDGYRSRLSDCLPRGG
jgi:hypothetical protein